MLGTALLLGAGSTALAASKLVLAVDTPPRTMDPHGSNADANLSIMANFFDGLLQRKGPDGTLVPALAAALGASGPADLEVLPAQGVKFHNGNPFTAADVKFTFERLSNPECFRSSSTPANH